LLINLLCCLLEQLICLGFANDSHQRLRRFAVIKTRFVITSLTVHLNRIAVGDCRDGVLFYSYIEDKKMFEHLHSDPIRRLVADCVLVDLDTAAVSDRQGNFCVLSSANVAADGVLIIIFQLEYLHLFRNTFGHG
jgi:splicing factor 3B subunit 3